MVAVLADMCGALQRWDMRATPPLPSLPLSHATTGSIETARPTRSTTTARAPMPMSVPKLFTHAKHQSREPRPHAPTHVLATPYSKTGE